MKLPEQLLQSLDGAPGFNREDFVRVHEEAKPPTSVRINEAKLSIGNKQLAISEEQQPANGPLARCPLPIAGWIPVPWCATGYYLSQRPSFTFDPLFHAGCYYVQEASSMFLEQAVKQLLDLSQPLKVLDLCAAPGGKTTHLQSLLSEESLLVSNEVIKQRSVVLTDNVMRWGGSNVFATNNDPKAFQKLPGYFDALVVDAPCSGSGLFRKDAEAMEEWSLNNVALCSQRQQRILADALPCVKEGGLLVYSTCSYSVEEDEAIMDWLVNGLEMDALSLNVSAFDGIVETKTSHAVGYRFYPDKIRGEGFFLACFRKRHGEGNARLRPSKPEIVSSKEKKILEDWVEGEGLEFIRFRNNVFALPQNLLNDFSVLPSALNLQYAGVQVGEIMKDKLVPHHALALNGIVSKNVPGTELPFADAIRYLQRQELSVKPERIGWQTARYAGFNLGWMNVLPNRINNYYPKELRILKAHNTAAFEK